MSVRAKPVVPTASQFSPTGQPFAYGPVYTGQPFAYGPAYTGHPYGPAYTGEAFGHAYGHTYGPPQTGYLFSNSKVSTNGNATPETSWFPQLVGPYAQAAAIGGGQYLCEQAKHNSALPGYVMDTAGRIIQVAGVGNVLYDNLSAAAGFPGNAMKTYKDWQSSST